MCHAQFFTQPPVAQRKTNRCRDSFDKGALDPIEPRARRGAIECQRPNVPLIDVERRADQKRYIMLVRKLIEEGTPAIRSHVQQLLHDECWTSGHSHELGRDRVEGPKTSQVLNAHFLAPGSSHRIHHLVAQFAPNRQRSAGATEDAHDMAQHAIPSKWIVNRVVDQFLNSE